MGSVAAQVSDAAGSSRRRMERVGQGNRRKEKMMSAEGDVVRQLGGLYVIGTERHESRRIDLQLRGRCGRQGDPGSSRFFLSLEDDLMRIFAGDFVKSMMERLGMERRRSDRIATCHAANLGRPKEGRRTQLRNPQKLAGLRRSDGRAAETRLSLPAKLAGWSQFAQDDSGPDSRPDRQIRRHLLGSTVRRRIVRHAGGRQT